MGIQFYTYGARGFAGSREAGDGSLEALDGRRSIWPRTDMSRDEDLKPYSTGGTTYIGRRLAREALRQDMHLGTSHEETISINDAVRFERD